MQADGGGSRNRENTHFNGRESPSQVVVVVVLTFNVCLRNVSSSLIKMDFIAELVILHLNQSGVVNIKRS